MTVLLKDKFQRHSFLFTLPHLCDFEFVVNQSSRISNSRYTRTFRVYSLNIIFRATFFYGHSLMIVLVLNLSKCAKSDQY